MAQYGTVGGIEVDGLSELIDALARTGPEIRKELKAEFLQIGEPVRIDTERLAVEKISHIGPRWSLMRSTVSRRFALLYVAPVQRGVRRAADPRARPNLAQLLLDKAMIPALERNRAEIEHNVERLVDRVTRDW